MSEKAIGLIFFVNTLVIVLAQLPMAKLLEGRRRMKALAAMTALWAAAWLIVLAGGLWLEAAAAAAVFAFAALVFGLGECFQGPDAGRARRRPRPAAAAGSLHGRLDQLVGPRLPLGPALGGVILATAPLALWPLAAVACLAAGVGRSRSSGCSRATSG